MMLRNRNVNSNNIVAGQQKPGELAKRGSKKALTQEKGSGEPLPKRAAFCDLSQAISNVLIDSTKKNDKKESLNKRVTRRSNSASEQLNTIQENSCDANEVSIVEIAVEDPCPSYDFDKESAGDPHAVHDYAFDIFQYYRSREAMFAVGDYMTTQKHINKDKRSALMDWMVEIQETFELNHETLYLAVKLVDIFLSKVACKIEDLQLVACSAIFIASKFDERSPPLIDDFIYVSEDSFSREQLIHMEMKMVDTIGYDLGCPLSYRYVRRYARVTKQDMATLTLSRYILETSLMFYEMVGVSESRLAAGAFLLALKMKNADATWTPVLHKYSGYRPDEVEPLMWELNHMMHVRSTQYARLETVFSKYSHEVFFHAAAVPLLTDRFSSDRAVQAPAGQGF